MDRLTWIPRMLCGCEGTCTETAPQTSLIAVLSALTRVGNPAWSARTSCSQGQSGEHLPLSNSVYRGASTGISCHSCTILYPRSLMQNSGVQCGGVSANGGGTRNGTAAASALPIATWGGGRCTRRCSDRDGRRTDASRAHRPNE